MRERNRPLKLKYVSDTIGDSWKQWRLGDVVTINAQTGTGKTTFITGNKTLSGLIDTLKYGEKLIYFCNRTALKRQIKLDLMVKYKIHIPYRVDEKGNPIKSKDDKLLVDFDRLDQIAYINDNVVISSYHSIAEAEKEKKFLKETINDLDDFKYIVCDEAHFVLADSAFMTRSNLVFNKIIRDRYHESILIYISATMDEILPPINKAFTSGLEWSAKGNKIHSYDTGIDYSYLNPQYFTNNKDIINTIINDKSDDKWIIFVTGKSSGEKIEAELNKRNISCKFVHSGTKNDEEVQNIINRNGFECKVLISTKFLDNGVNIKDEQLKNIVVMSYDRITFIQEIGRVRIDIENPPSINLFIKTMNGRIFQNHVLNQYQPKLLDIELQQKEPLKFQNKYNMNLRSIDQDIFYLDENDNWRINVTGYARLLKDNDFAQKMIEAFKNKNKFAYIKEQLKWLELENTFDPSNLIVDVADVEEVQELQKYLEDNVGRLYLKDDKDELINAINLTDSRGRKQTSPSLLKGYLEENFSLTLKYDCETSRVIDGVKKKFKNCWKIRKIV